MEVCAGAEQDGFALALILLLKNRTIYVRPYGILDFGCDDETLPLRSKGW